MRGFYNDVARLQVSLSLSQPQPNPIQSVTFYMVLLSCRMCVKGYLIAAQIWNRGRLSPDLLKLSFSFFKVITLFTIQAVVC